MSCKEEGQKSVLSGKTDDSDWSDIDTDAEDGAGAGNEGHRLKIDLVSSRRLKHSYLTNSCSLFSSQYASYLIWYTTTK